MRSYLHLNSGAILFQVGPWTGDEGRLSHILQPALEFKYIFRRTDLAEGHGEKFILR